MKAIALDDEPLALEIVKSHASKIPWLKLEACFTDAFKAMEYLQNNPVDLLFLDIKMPDISGLDFLSGLHNKNSYIVIFTTAYSEHAVKSFELDAVDYLLKPFSLARFMKACGKALELHNARKGKEEPEFCFIKTGYEQVKVFYDQILYVEAEGNYLSFILPEIKHLSRMTMAEAEQLLPMDRFIRIHRSYIVNIRKIDIIERSQLTVAGKALPVGEAYRQAIQGLSLKS
jgi:two-component system LytT family response regulator